MRKSIHKAQTSALPAIAAALALSSTPLLAQQATPAQVEPPPMATPASPTPDQTTTTPDPSTAPVDAVDPSTNSDTSAKSAAPPTRAKTVIHAKADTKSSATTVHSSAPRNATAHVSTHRSNTVKTAATEAPAPKSAMNPTPVVKQTISLNDRQQTGTTQTPSAKAPRKHNNTVPIAAGSALALLAVGSAAVAINRRRHEDDELWEDEAAIEQEPLPDDVNGNRGAETMIENDQAPILAPPVSAIRWDNNEQTRANRVEEPNVETDDRKAGETWVERAYRGPSTLNPSVSLKARLKRAAFFDKRERDAAAGLARPVDPTAGLPERLVDGREESQLA